MPPSPPLVIETAAAQPPHPQSQSQPPQKRRPGRPRKHDRPVAQPSTAPLPAIAGPSGETAVVDPPTVSSLHSTTNPGNTINDRGAKHDVDRDYDDISAFPAPAKRQRLASASSDTSSSAPHPHRPKSSATSRTAHLLPPVPKGHGVCLGNIPAVAQEIDRRGYQDDTVHALHRLIFDNGNPGPILLRFCGFDLDDDSATTARRLSLLRWPLADLRALADLLRLQRDGTKHDLHLRIWSFLACPAPLYGSAPSLRLRSRPAASMPSSAPTALVPTTAASVPAMERWPPSSSRADGNIDDDDNDDDAALASTQTHQQPLTPTPLHTELFAPPPTSTAAATPPSSPDSHTAPPRLPSLTVTLEHRHRTAGSPPRSEQDPPPPLQPSSPLAPPTDAAAWASDEAPASRSSGSPAVVAAVYPSDEMLLVQIKWIVCTHRPAELTTNGVRARLESRLHSPPLLSRMPFIRACLTHLLSYPAVPPPMPQSKPVPTSAASTARPPPPPSPPQPLTMDRGFGLPEGTPDSTTAQRTPGDTADGSVRLLRASPLPLPAPVPSLPDIGGSAPGR